MSRNAKTNISFHKIERWNIKMVGEFVLFFFHFKNN